MERRFPIGTIVKHYKHKDKKSKKKNVNNKYLYVIIGYALDVDTQKEVVIYRALYREGNNFGLFTRPSSDFYSTIPNKEGKEIPKFEEFNDNEEPKA